MGRVGRVSRVAAFALVLFLPGRPDLLDLPGLSVLSAQVPYEQASRDLSSADASLRLRAVQMLKDAAYPEAAVPLAALVNDPRDEVQLEAIAAELNSCRS